MGENRSKSLILLSEMYALGWELFSWQQSCADFVWSFCEAKCFWKEKESKPNNAQNFLESMSDSMHFALLSSTSRRTERFSLFFFYQISTNFLPFFVFSAPQNVICIKTKKKKGKSSKIVLWKYDWEKDLSILSWLWSLHFFQPPSSSENQR